MSWISRLAAAGTVPVFAAIGEDGLTAAEDLALDPAVQFVATPRRAAVLLVIGATAGEDLPELHRLHDQLPHPRATVWWKAEAQPEFADAVQAPAGEDPAARIAGTFRALMSGERRSESDILPDEPPNPWRGKGEHGQGGEGMMGGTPYGRPMAMTAEDIRDGLTLDAYSASFGPFLPMLPPGMVLDLTLQGDVVQKASMRRRPYPQRVSSEDEDLLRRIGRMLRLLGLAGQADRFFRAARSLTAGESIDFGKLRRMARWSGALRAVPQGIGSFGSPPADAKARLARWLDGIGQDGTAKSSGPAEEPIPNEDLGSLLTGLEWQEAMLVVNSIVIDSLRMFPEAKEAENASHQGSEHQHHHQPHHEEKGE